MSISTVPLFPSERSSHEEPEQHPAHSATTGAPGQQQSQPSTDRSQSEKALPEKHLAAVHQQTEHRPNPTRNGPIQQQPDTVKGIFRWRDGRLTYRYADQLPLLEKLTIAILLILAIFGSPLSLICTLPALLCIQQVGSLINKRIETYIIYHNQLAAS